MWNARQYETAEVLLARAIADADPLLRPANTLTVAAWGALGLLFSVQGRFGLAIVVLAQIQQSVRVLVVRRKGLAMLVGHPFAEARIGFRPLAAAVD